ncbi:pecanex-like protein 4 [Centruroides vittatus]|uniref:pecanex-like protein 4 n=1 Tax=Centruroides vittatus TaxID=120091 RepID=UPI00351064EF
MSTPLISEYKRPFIVRRLLQTFLGGPKIKLGFKAPVYIYIIHIVLFLIPWILAESITPFVDNEEVNITIAMYIYGSVIGALVLLIQFLNYFAQRETSVVSKINKTNHLLEDDEVEFSACCGIETYQFIFARKNTWFYIICYSLISAVVCATGLEYLYIPKLKEWWNNKLTAIVLHVFGWLTICISQYSLTVVNPPEPAIYNNEKHHFMKTTFRPFYVCCMFAVHYVSWKYETWKEIDGYLHIIFVLLPLLWLLGTLPPQDALLLWAEEQLLCFGLGGSTVPSDWWLIFSLGISISLMLIIYFLQNWTTISIVASCSCYLLSLDLESICGQPLKRLYSNFSKKNVNNQKASSSYKFKPFVFHIIMILVTGLEVWGCNQLDINQHQSEVWRICSIVTIAILIIVWLLGQLQRIYIFGGMIKNKFYPPNIQNVDLFQEKKKKFLSLRYLRISLKILTPFLMIFILSVFGQLDRSEGKCLLTSLSTVRAFRLVWQHTENFCLDISLMYIVKECTNIMSDLSIPFVVDLLIIGIARDRLVDLWKKLYVILIISFTSISNKKQRMEYSWLLLVLNIVFLPVIVIFIILSIVLSSPIVSLFTLPIFLTGFPRPNKFWPGKVGITPSHSMDNVYYQQMVSSLKDELQVSFSRGSLGFINNGDFFLARFQDRLLWIHILERGFNYCKTSIKGLELQETSCHTLEASQVDEIFEQSFKRDDDDGKLQNPHIFNTLVPCDVAIAKTYSDARNVLTGIIHSKDTLNLIKEEFPKILTWMLVKHIISNKYKSQSKIDKPVSSIKRKIQQPYSSECNINPNGVNRPLSRESFKSFSEFQIQPIENIHRNNEKWAEVVRSPSPISSWPDDDDPIESNPVTYAKIEKVQMKNSNQDTPKNQQITIPGCLQEINLSSTKDVNVDEKKKWNDVIYYSSSPLIPPKDWMKYPSNIYLYHEKEVNFSIDWFHKTVKILAESIKELNVNELLDDVNIPKIYEKIITYCYHAFHYDIFSVHGPDEVCKLFLGTLPSSPLQEWLENCQDLYIIVLTSYRYSVKLSLDQTLIGPITSDEEFYEYLQEYDDYWHIGIDGDQAWKDAVLRNCPYLFSISYDLVQDLYTSHLLSLEDQPIFIGSLNSALVQSIWSSLCIELLYLTNDDDERYSIQAEPVTLRNLTVQAANPPLGYPVFSSMPIPFSTLL